MSEHEAEAKQPPRKHGGCLPLAGRFALFGLIFLAITLVWLNGPGMRWLGPKVAAHFLAKAGMSGVMRLGGTLLGGVEVYDLEITSAEGALERLVVDRLVTDYRFREVIKGKVRGISGTGIHVDLRIVETEEKEPVDFAALAKTLRKARRHFMPLALDVEDLSVSAKKDGERVVEITGASLSHRPGEDLIELEVGTITDASGRKLLSQEVALVWEEGKLALGKLELLPTVGVRNFELLLPDDGEISANGVFRMRGAVFKLDVGGGIRDVRVDLMEGELDFGNPLAGVDLGLPMQGRLTSLAVEVRDVFPDCRMAVGTGEAFVEGFSYDGWNVPEASVGVVSMKWEGSGVLPEMALRGEITDLDGTWVLNDAEGTPQPPFSAKAAKITYDWPGKAVVSGLVVETQGQTMKLDAKLAETLLTLEEFVWLEGEVELAKGRGTLPMPGNFAKLGDFLANDTRPLDLTLDTETKKAGDIIMQGQGDSGGWVYKFESTNSGDNSVGFWQIQALKACKHTGLWTDSKFKPTIRKALGWLEKVQGPNGAIGYRGNPSQSPGLTGGGVLAFQMWDEGRSKEARDGIKWIAENAKFKWGEESANLYYHYYHAQAMINNGGREWDDYNNMFRDELIKAQAKDGTWTQGGIKHGPINTHMATCMAALMLEVYYRFLPGSE